MDMIQCLQLLGCGMEWNWVCLTTTHVLQDILAVLHIFGYSLQFICLLQLCGNLDFLACGNRLCLPTVHHRETQTNNFNMVAGPVNYLVWKSTDLKLIHSSYHRIISCHGCRTIALVATIICWLYPMLNKFYLILSCHQYGKYVGLIWRILWQMQESRIWKKVMLSENEIFPHNFHLIPRPFLYEIQFLLLDDNTQQI